MLDHQIHSLRNAMLVIASSTILAYDSIDTNWQDHSCYARAMIAYDSVINARLGVPAEHALNLAVLVYDPLSNQYTYSTELLSIVLTAYLWNDSPHDYAKKFFYHCALSQHKLSAADFMDS